MRIGCSRLQVARTLAVATLLISASSAQSLPGGGTSMYTETFTSTIYEDANATTADWNTSSGQLQLPNFVPTVVATFATPTWAVAVDVEGNTAFVADFGTTTGSIEIVDITDPLNPQLITSYATSGNANDVFVHGNTMYVADWMGGITIVDVTNLASPQLLTNFLPGSRPHSVFVDGDLMYVGEFVRMSIYDVSNPAAPVIVGTHEAGGLINIYDVVVQGTVVYLAANREVRSIDVSDPANPQLLDTYTVDAYGVEAAGDRLYVAAQSDGFVILDILDPASMKHKATIATPGGNALKVEVAGDVAYVCDDTGGLLLVDISVSVAPAIFQSESSRAVDVAVEGHTAYVAGRGGGLRVTRVAEPMSDMELVDNYYLLSSPHYFRPGAMAVDGNLLALGGDSHIYLFDIHDPAAITLQSTHVTSFVQRWRGLAIEGDMVYACADELPGGNPGFLCVDVSSPYFPATVGTANIRGVDLAVAWPYVFIVNGNLEDQHGKQGRLRVVDVSNPSLPSEVASHQFFSCGGFPCPTWGVDIEGDVLYIATARGLWSVDISDPENPQEISVLYEPSQTSLWDVEVEGDIAYVIEAWTALHAIDVSDPSSMSTIGTLRPGNSPARVTVAGDLAFYGSTTGGLGLVDVTDPTNMSQIGLHPSNVLFGNLAMEDDIVYALDRNSNHLHSVRYLQRGIATQSNIGQSTEVDGADDLIGRVCVTATETGSVSYEVSANGGADWQSVLANGRWHTVLRPGRDLLWRATLDWPGSGPLPSVSTLEMSWVSLGGRSGKQPSLEESTPDPFNPTTTIAYSLPHSVPVLLTVYDVAGRRVRALVSGAQPAGRHSVTWDGTDDRGGAVASGTYFYRLETPGFSQTRKVTLLK